MSLYAGVSQAQTRLADVGLVVLDEVHYLGDPSRGSVWEEVIINCPKHIQLCAMSATVANADALGGWIDEVRDTALLECKSLPYRRCSHWSHCSLLKAYPGIVPFKLPFCNAAQQHLMSMSAAVGFEQS